jgi:hypothetical protein
MQNHYIKLDTEQDKERKPIKLPAAEDVPVSSTEKIVRKDIEKLAQNTKDIQKIKEQIEQKRDEKK